MRMLNPATISFFSFLLSSMSLISIYYQWFTYGTAIYLIPAIALITLYLFNRRVHQENRKADKLMILSSSFFTVAIISHFIYSNWKLINLISEIMMAKIIVVLLGLFALYINIIYIRAEQSYKKKRGNQRIREEPKQGYIEQFMEGFKKKEKNPNEIVLQIGLSAERDD